MNKIFKLLFIALAAFTVSCDKEDDNSTAPPRDYSEQYAKDLDSIDEFIDTHKMIVTADFDVTYELITPTNLGTSIRDSGLLKTKYVKVASHNLVTDDVDHPDSYKVYYIDFNEGGNKRPSEVDSIYVSYRGVLLDNDQFDQAQTPVWFTLDNVVRGWSEIIPFFKTGIYDGSGGPNPVSFTDFGAGVMFLPSGLGYYNRSAGSVPVYSPMIFNFKLFELRYRDHDRDGILSKDEIDPAKGPYLIDTDHDSDGIPDYADVDDDGDQFLTLHERRRPFLIPGQDEDERTYYPLDGAATDDPATPYDDTQGIPSCSGDFTTPGRVRKHIDATCHQAPDA